MKKIVLFLLVISLLSYSRDLPVDKETYLFKTDSVSHIASAYSNSALYDKDLITVNPASLTGITQNTVVLGYNYYDSETLNYYISEDDNIFRGDISYIAFSSNTGGIYARRLAFGDTKYVDDKYSEGSEHKYNLDLYEIGLTIAEKSKSAKGLSTGLTGKLYTGSMLEAGGDELIVDRCYGFGFDVGFLYQKEYVSTSVVFKDILGNIYWDDYDKVKVDSAVNLSLGLSSEYIKYSFSINRVFLDTATMTYGQGVEMKILHLPEEYSNYMIKGLKAVFRMGTYGEEIFNGNKFTYGLELSNDKYFINGATVTDSFGDVFGDNNIYKFSIGTNF